MQRRLLALLPPFLFTACPADPDITDDTSDDMSESTGDETGEPTTGEPAGLGECDYGPAEATRLALVTNDFMAPAAVHVLDLVKGGPFQEDIAPASSDPALAWGQGMLVVIGRFGFNSLDVLDGTDWQSLAELSVSVDDVPEPNPQALTFAADGRAYLTLLASAAVPIYDFKQPAADNPVGALDLTALADADGSPEAGVALACGDTLFIGIQRLVEFVPVDHSYLVPFDLVSQQPIDLDPATDGPQGIELLGPWPKQIRRDPADDSGHTALVLTSGVERVDLVAGTSSWAVAPERLAALDVEGFDVQSFAVAPDGASVYIVATAGDFPNSALHQFSLADDSATTLISDLTTREKVLEIVGTTLYVGDANVDLPLLRSFDLTQNPPLQHGPQGLPGAPYLLYALP